MDKREYNREYSRRFNQRPDVKERNRQRAFVYYHTPGLHERILQRSNERSRRVYKEKSEIRLHKAAYGKRYYEANKAKVQERHKQYYQLHKDKEKERNDHYNETHRDQQRKSAEAYRMTHRSVYALASRRYDAKKHGLPNTLTLEQWEAIKRVHKYRCVYCGKKPKILVQEHYIPVSQGGGTTCSNIVPACRSCNSKKHDLPAPKEVPIRLLL